MLRDFSDTVAFVKVVQEGSFTAAARVLKVPKTRVSRKVQELESRLHTQLLNRTTRSLKLTEAGAVYFQHCERVVKNLEDAENAVAELQQHPRGWLRITAPYWLATRVLAPLLTEFRRFYPEVFPQLLLGHEVVDLVAKDIDVAFRLQEGTLPDSTLTARRLGALPMGIYGAPAYLERAGMPQHPSELAEHACLLTEFYFNRPAVEWPLSSGGERSQFKVRAVAVASDPEALHGFLLEGVGLFMTNHVRVKSDVAAGRLVRVLPEWAGPEPTLYAIRPGGGVQPPKVKAFLDFLIPRLDLKKIDSKGSHI
ncbi:MULTISPECIES: LysR family transcriptional regulator [unclassified Mesorhizobium]|uniref:LysR family transcriptional regulator n=1 Tax=unclassified Mesorhizobium TaxID=325217 RepID=UPI000FCA7169|nr:MULTISPECIES: LysR family transcriptional regulator [unclassified Mesorhizobium]RUU26322.1 LysR family transcriptional regulator [Mesorhizobium sp. M6A.T.Ce.TU.016.01.1.1]RWQ62092.1 MAG: LysR family transcriptional regulator [Mesorhizobium sp.]